MYANKYKVVILQETRKKLDRSWDILMSKTKITGKNFKLTKTHTLMYIKQRSKHSARNNRDTSSLKTKKTPQNEINTTFINKFQA